MISDKFHEIPTHGVSWGCRFYKCFVFTDPNSLLLEARVSAARSIGFFVSPVEQHWPGVGTSVEAVKHGGFTGKTIGKP